MSSRAHSLPLTIAAAAVLAIAIIHVAAIFIGPAAFDYLDAPALGRMMEEGSMIPVAATLGVVGAMLIFAAYAWSGAGQLRRLPRLRVALLVIGGIFTLRGLGVLWFTYLAIVGSPDSIPREIGFSLVSLGIGLLYLRGGWRQRDD